MKLGKSHYGRKFGGMMQFTMDHCMKWPHSANVRIFWSGSAEGAVVLWTSCFNDCVKSSAISIRPFFFWNRNIFPFYYPIYTYASRFMSPRKIEAKLGIMIKIALVVVVYGWIALTHWGRNKMIAVFQTTFSNAFSWRKIFEFRLKFHWCLYLRDIPADNGLVRQAIIWTNNH